MSLKGIKQKPDHIAKRMVGAKKGWIKKGQRLSLKTEFKKGHISKGNESGYFKYKEKHPNWKGGKSWSYLVKIIRIRDDYTCQICGLRDIEIIEVDHVKPKSKHPKLKYEINNLMCLCPNCHRRKTLRDRKMVMVGG